MLVDLPGELIALVLQNLPPAEVERLRRASSWAGTDSKKRVAALILDRQVKQVAHQRLHYTEIRLLSRALRDSEKVINLMFSDAEYPAICFDAVSDRLRGKLELVWRMVTVDPGCLRFASAALRGNRDLVWHAIRRVAIRDRTSVCGTHISIEWISPELQDDEAIVRIVLQQKPLVAPQEFQHASRRLRADSEVVRFALEINPSCLQFASAELRGDLDMVMFAIRCVTPRHRAMCEAVQLKWLSPELRDNLGVVRAVVKSTKGAASLYFCAASSRLRGDRTLMLYAISQDPRCLHLGSQELRRDFDLAMAAAAVPVSHEWDSLDPRRLAAPLRNNKAIVDRLAASRKRARRPRVMH